MTNQNRKVCEIIAGIAIALTLLILGLSGCSKQSPTAPMAKPTESIKQITPPYKLLCIGNSITFHPEYHGEFDWPGDWGMAAETQAQDYVHQLQGMLQTYLQQSVSLEFTNCAVGFEVEFYQRGIKPFEAWFGTDANIIVLFFSDNCPSDKFDDYFYEEYYNKVLSRFADDSRLVVCVTTWFDVNHYRDPVIKKSCARNGVPCVDISALYSENNYINTCFGEGRTYNNTAVDCHPGNNGMYRIAQEIYNVLVMNLP